MTSRHADVVLLMEKLKKNKKIFIDYDFKIFKKSIAIGRYSKKKKQKKMFLLERKQCADIIFFHFYFGGGRLNCIVLGCNCFKYNNINYHDIKVSIIYRPHMAYY